MIRESNQSSNASSNDVWEPPNLPATVTVFKETVSEQEKEQLFSNPQCIEKFLYYSSWSIKGGGKYDLGEQIGQKLFALIKETNCKSIFMYYLEQPKILYQMTTIKFNSLTQILLGKSNIQSFEALAFLDTEVIKALLVHDLRVDKVKPLSKLNWRCLRQLNFKNNKMVDFGNWINRINSCTSSMFMSLSDFQQDDFSCMAKLKPIENATIIITNRYRGSKDNIPIIAQKKLHASLKHKVGKEGNEGFYVWDQSKTA